MRRQKLINVSVINLVLYFVNNSLLNVKLECTLMYHLCTDEYTSLCQIHYAQSCYYLYIGQTNSSSCCEHDFPNTKGQLEILFTVNLPFFLSVTARLSHALRWMKLSAYKYVPRTFT